MNRLCSYILILCVAFPALAFANVNKELHQAVKNGDMNAVIKALENGADIASTNKKGNTPLHRAASRDNYKIVELLVKKGAPLDVKNNSGKTPLMQAARKGNYRNAQVLVAAGADMNLQDNSGTTAYSFAAQKDHHNLAKYLKLQMKSRVSVAIFAELGDREISQERFYQIAERAFASKKWVVESKEGNVVIGLLEKRDQLFKAKFVLTPNAFMVRYLEGMGVLNVSYLNNIIFEALKQLD